MWTIKEMFYTTPEVVWILKEEGKKDGKDGKKDGKDGKGEGKKDGKGEGKKDGKDSKQDAKAEPPKLTPLEIAFGPLLPYYYPPYPAQESSKDKPADPKKNIVELKIPYYCCSVCNDRLMIALNELPGLKKDTVKSENKKGKVTLELTKGTADDVILQARKVYCKARLWNKDD